MSEQERLEREELRLVVLGDVQTRAQKVASIIDYHTRIHDMGAIVEYETTTLDDGRIVTIPIIEIIDLKLARDPEERRDLLKKLKDGTIQPLPVEEPRPEPIPIEKTTSKKEIR